MQSQPINRRQMLRGAGGAALLLPFLPSIHGEARAQGRAARRFFLMGTWHGGADPANMYPAEPTTIARILPDFDAHQAPLSAARTGGNAVLSPILTAPATTLTDRLIGKMNVLRGFDLANPLQHNAGSFLGNNANYVGGPAETRPRVTIDQVMAYAPSFYREGDGMRVRSINIEPSGEGSLSATYQNPAARTGVQTLTPTGDLAALFDRLFAGSTPSQPQTMARKPIIDRVIENYRRLRDGNRRLSAEDRVRLEGHIGRLRQVEQFLELPAPISCGSPLRPTATRADRPAFYQAAADLIATAFACNVSRVAVMSVIPSFTNFTGNWHMDVAHMYSTPEAQAWLVQEYQKNFERVFAYLASRLDGITDADGKSVLDNTLMIWSQESGAGTHSGYQMPVITAGSAGGFFKTGIHVDYRNKTLASQTTGSNHSPNGWSGLPYPQVLCNALDAMGVDRADWAADQGTLKGYGEYSVAKIVEKHGWDAFPHFAPGVLEAASDKLPLVT